MSDTYGGSRAASRTRIRRRRASALVQLTLVRVREFIREPEAVFWAMFFPILLTAGLGIAFRSSPADVLKVVDVVDADRRGAAPGAGARRQPLATTRRRRRRCAPARSALLAAVRQRRRRRLPLRRHEPGGPRRADARRSARSSAPAAASIRCPSRDELVREPGSRYVDFLVPGLVGLGIMSNALWGLGFSIVDSRRRKLMKRLVATPMSRSVLPAVVPAVAHDDPRRRGRRAGRLRRARLRRAGARPPDRSRGHLRARLARVQRARRC